MIFALSLGAEGFAALPPLLRALHDPAPCLVLEGEAAVDPPAGAFAWLAARLAGLPRPGRAIPLRLTITAGAGGETWVREFGGHRFASSLSWQGRPGCVEERVRLVDFELALRPATGELRMEITGRRCLGLSLPAWLAPRGTAREWVDAAGRIRFEVVGELPWGLGRVVAYRGWLRTPLERERAPGGALP